MEKNRGPGRFAVSSATLIFFIFYFLFFILNKGPMSRQQLIARQLRAQRQADMSAGVKSSDMGKELPPLPQNSHTFSTLPQQLTIAEQLSKLTKQSQQEPPQQAIAVQVKESVKEGTAGTVATMSDKSLEISKSKVEESSVVKSSGVGVAGAVESSVVKSKEVDSRVDRVRSEAGALVRRFMMQDVPDPEVLEKDEKVLLAGAHEDYDEAGLGLEVRDARYDELKAVEAGCRSTVQQLLYFRHPGSLADLEIEYLFAAYRSYQRLSMACKVLLDSI